MATQSRSIEGGVVADVSFDVALRDEPGRVSQEWPANVLVERDAIHAFFVSGTADEAWSIYLERKVKDDILPGTITIVPTYARKPRRSSQSALSRGV